VHQVPAFRQDAQGLIIPITVISTNDYGDYLKAEYGNLKIITVISFRITVIIIKMEKFGNYEILGEIGRGGMANVLKARQTDLRRIVAIKMIKLHLSEDKEFVRMFRNEAVIAANLNHPGIVSIYEMGMQDGSYYISMEYVDGRTLAQVLDRAEKMETSPSGIPLASALFVITSVLNALQFAHTKNVIHRDVNPSNILISNEGRVKLSDFGIARAAFMAPSNTSVGMLKGKLSYLSPEQAKGENTDLRADIFAAGIVMYEMLAGRRLFAGESEFEILEKVRNAEIETDLRSLEGVPQEILKVLRQSLQKDRDKRYGSAQAVLTGLEAAARELGIVFSEKDAAALLQPAEDTTAAGASPTAGAQTQVISSRIVRAATGSGMSRKVIITASAALLCTIIAVLFFYKPGTKQSVEENAAPAAVTVPEEKKNAESSGEISKAPAAPLNNADPSLTTLKEDKAVYSAKKEEIPGAIYINSTPADAIIYFDNAAQGEGSRVIKNVKAGKHAIKITHPDYEDEIRAVEITPDKPVLRIIYKNGEITLE